MALVHGAFAAEHETLREFGYDLDTVSPLVWHSPLYALWERVSRAASEALVRSTPRKQFAPHLDLVAREAGRRVAASADSIVSTTLAALIGLAPDEIDDQYDEWGTSRTATIADTERNSAISWGRFETGRSLGFRTKRWRTQQDGDVRDSHVANQNQGTIPYDSEFQSHQLYPHEGSDPAELINCRCWLEELDNPGSL